MSEQGKKIAMGIGIYLVVKQLLNVMLGADVFTLVLPVAISVCMALHFWKYTNYAVAGITALIALYYLPANFGGLPSTWLYLTEGILDIGVSAVLILSDDVKAYFNQTE